MLPWQAAEPDCLPRDLPVDELQRCLYKAGFYPGEPERLRELGLHMGSDLQR